MRVRRVVALVALAGLVLAACETDDDPDPAEEVDDLEDLDDPDEEAAPDEPVEVEVADVELLDPGQEPHEQLRLTLREGAEFPATLTFEEEPLGTDTEMEGPEPELPPAQVSTLHLRFTVEAVADGEATISFAYEDIDIEGVGEEQMEQLLATTGEIVLDDRSQLIAASPSAQGLEQLPVPLPEEAVGEGATWEIVTEDLFDLPIDEVMTVELVSLDGDEYELEITTASEGPDEPVELPAQQPGAEVTLEEVIRDGTGTRHASLAEPFPISARISTETSLRLTAPEEMGGEQTERLREEIVFERQ